MSDDPGVMGNLPRSRPGRRSDKRTVAARASTPAGSGRSTAGGKTARASSGATKAGRPTAGPSKAARAARAAGGGPADSRARPSTPERGDPLTDAVRIATRLAGAGLGVAAGIARRLPRP